MSNTYHRRQAVGLCGYCGMSAQPHGSGACLPCRRLRRLKAQEARDLNTHYFRRPPQRTRHAALTHYPGPLLAHCGRWWMVEPGQVTCGACGVTYTEKAGSA